jgi:hypothetical protein
MDPNIAGNVKLKTRLILHEGECSQLELARIAAEAKYGPLEHPGVDCKLECGGQIVAVGELVTENGKTVFKIQETEEDNNGTR